MSAVNRGPEAAPLHLLPHLWFRNTWCLDEHSPRPELEALHHPRCGHRRPAPALGQRFLYCEGAGELLFADNETNRYRLWGQPNPTQYQKDGINDYVVQGRRDAVNPAKKGTKSAAHTLFNVEPGQTATMRLRLTDGRRLSSTIRWRASTRPSASACARPTSTTRRSRRRRSAPTPRKWFARARPGCCGPSRPTSTTSSGG